jgi:hypothetical protein
MSRDALVNRHPVGEIERPDPWVPSSELRRLVVEAAADSDLLDDVADVRGDEIDDAYVDRGCGARLRV